MPRLRAESSATIDASPEQVYDMIADYQHSHARILPKENFRDLKVEQGGKGAGAIISFISRSGGVERAIYKKELAQLASVASEHAGAGAG